MSLIASTCLREVEAEKYNGDRLEEKRRTVPVAG